MITHVSNGGLRDNTIKVVTVGICSFVLGLIAMDLVNTNKVKTDNLTVECLREVRINADWHECTIFEWRGETYATEYAPTLAGEE